MLLLVEYFVFNMTLTDNKTSKHLYIKLYLLGINIYLRGLKMVKILTKTHSPNLATILMVEKTLKESKELLTIAKLKKILPKKVMHQTLIQILDYLQMSGKIIIGTKGILWIYTERKELNALIKRGTEV
jgi:hypothetical protein